MATTHDPATSEPAPPLSRWARAAHGDVEALRELAGSYWYCVYAWWRRAGREDAVAATVACFAQWLGGAPPHPEQSGAGRMREWVRARLAEYPGGTRSCASQTSEERAADDQGLAGARPSEIEIAPEWAEQRYAQEPAGTADDIYQRRWALTVLEFTMEALRAEYAAAGKEALFIEVTPYASFEGGDDDRYEATAKRMGFTVGAARKAVFDFRSRHRELLRGFVGDTVADPADIDSELTALLIGCDMIGAPAESAPLPTAIRSFKPDELLARAMRSVRMTSGGQGLWTPPTDAEVARLFPQYEMLGILGRGGMGAVYKARQVALDRLVAIKLLPLEISVDKDFADRFVREARAMAKLSHPNIISVFDFGTTNEGHLYFVMEFIEGANLQHMIHGPGLDPARALEIMSAVCDALDYAHSEGVIHRDIKPANVMVDKRGRVKVADFGLARLTDPSAEQMGHTMTGTVMGTPDYMAPEQSRGMNVDHRADIYSLGVMLYEMLCREVPKGFCDPPSERTGCSTQIDEIVKKAMQAAPDRRFQSTQEMRTAITEARPSSAAIVPSPSTLPPSGPTQVVQPRSVEKLKVAVMKAIPPPAERKSKLPLYGGLAAALVALLGGAIWLGSARAPRAGSGALAGTNSSPSSAGESSAGAPKTAREARALPGPLEPGAIRLWDSPERLPPGPFRWKDGAVFIDKGSAISTHKQYATDALLRARVRMNPDRQDAQLCLRTSDSNPSSMYTFQTSSESNSSSLRAVINGKGRDLKKWPLPREYGPDEWVETELRVVGSRISVRFDGADLGSVEDVSITAPGKAMLYAGANGYFRDIVFVPLDKVATSPSPAPQVSKSPSTPAAPTKEATSEVRTFGGHRYQLLNELMSWGDADTKAKAMGGHLATINDPTERSWVRDNIVPMLPGLTTKVAERRLFLGGFRDGNSAWRWDTAEPFDMALWLGAPSPGNETSGRRYLAWDFGNHKWDSASPTWNAFPLVEWDDESGAKSSGVNGEPWQELLRAPGKLGLSGGAERTPEGLRFTDAGGAMVRSTSLGRQRDGALRLRTTFGDLRPQLRVRGNRTGVYQLYLKDAKSIFLDHYNAVSKETTVLREFFLREPLQPEQDYELELRVVSQMFTAKLNGEILGTFTDGTRKEGDFNVGVTDRGKAPTLVKSIEFLDLDAPGGAGVTPATSLTTATKDAPFVNTLGMKFVPVPGTKALFSIWDTRVQDYAEFAKAQEAAGKQVDGSWKAQQKDGVPVGREPDHPVVGVSWEDAQAFCQWLTEKESAEGKLPPGQRYRLPTDEEWSTAVGLPPEQGATPEEKSGKNDVDFPWGKEWPPTKKVGNYADETFHAKFPPKKDEKDGKMQNDQWVRNYTDGHATTAPVVAFPANAYGLYDMGGNVWQWCEDRWNAGHKDHVLRGTSWRCSVRSDLSSSHRHHNAPTLRYNDYGFRCVLASGP